MLGVGSTTHSPLISPQFPQWGSDDRLLREDLKKLMIALEENWPTLRGDWQSQVTFTSQDRAELLFRGLRVEVSGLEALAKQIDALHQQEQTAEVKKEAALERLTQVKYLRTALSVMWSGFRMGAGTALVASGAVVPGVALLTSALISGAHEISQKLDGYRRLSESLGGDETSISSRTKILERGISYLDTSLSLATLLVSGTDGFSAGWKALTSHAISAQGVTNIGAGTNALMAIAQGKLEGDRGRLDVDYMGVRLQIVVHGQERDHRQENVELSMEHVEKLFDLLLGNIRAQKRMESVWRNLGASASH